MKKLLLIITLIFSCAMASNAPSRYVDAILECDAMKNLLSSGNEILSIKQTDKYINCPGCFEFDVVYRVSPATEIKIAKFYTKDSAFVGHILVFRRDGVERGPHS